MNILIIEDEESLLESITSYLNKEGYFCTPVNLVKDAEEKICSNLYDCILIDINLPDGNGLNLIPLIKKRNKETGIIIISARDTLDERIQGLEYGADDYIVKPFHLSELNARIFSLMRRILFKGDDLIEFKEIKIFPTERSVQVNGYSLDLTRKEYDLLIYLISNKDRILTKEAICEYLWGDYAVNSGSLDFVYTHIKNLRKKIHEQRGADYISTIYGVGYKFTEQ